MSLRTMTAQYIGGTLYLPPLEREVKRIEVGGVTFVPERTCKVIEMHEHVTMDEPDIAELSCGHDIMVFDMEPPNYCPNCGARVVDA